MSNEVENDHPSHEHPNPNPTRVPHYPTSCTTRRNLPPRHLQRPPAVGFRSSTAPSTATTTTDGTPSKREKKNSGTMSGANARRCRRSTRGSGWCGFWFFVGRWNLGFMKLRLSGSDCMHIYIYMCYILCLADVRMYSVVVRPGCRIASSFFATLEYVDRRPDPSS